MNPLLNILFAIGERVIDHKKPHSLTNITTASGAATGMTAYMLLVESDDPMIKAIGACCIVTSLVLTFFKEQKEDDKQG